MNLLQSLIETYNNINKDVIGKEGTLNFKPLLPPFHALQNSHIEIILDPNGNFLDANVVDNKNDQEIIIPCTEKSASRTSGIEPHPLCDKIQYCAKDYIGNKKSHFSHYIRLLDSWYNSDRQNPFLIAIFKYVIKGSLCHDLVETSKPIGKPGQDLGDFLVRWKVEIPGINESRCWKNNSLYESWQMYCEQQEAVEDVCMVLGTTKNITINHPKRIRHSGDGGKLISSNDKAGFTFLGRFLLNDFKNEKIASQVVSISIEASQKAHSALRWLIDRQSYRNGDQVFVSWAVSGKRTPDTFEGTLSIFGESDEEILQESKCNTYFDAGQSFARKLSFKIAGYKADLANSNKIVILGLDSSGPGRISITYYRELTGSEFLSRVESWHNHMAWHFNIIINDPIKKNLKHNCNCVFAPSVKSISESCYGPKRDEDFKKFRKSLSERLLPCIIDEAHLPFDLVDQAVRKASNPMAYENKWQWEQAISVACALVKCFTIRNINLKPHYDMALENERTDRDYLYGRLLAVAEHIEEIALKVANESRETTAARFMQRFADQPFSTWRNIELALRPYISRLSTNRPGFLYNMQIMLDEIHDRFDPVEYQSDARLTGTYLLGYHCQRLEFRSKRNIEIKTE